MDVNYEPPQTETRTLFGLTLEQKANDAKIDEKLFNKENVVSSKKEVEQSLIVHNHNQVN